MPFEFYHVINNVNLTYYYNIILGTRANGNGNQYYFRWIQFDPSGNKRGSSWKNKTNASLCTSYSVIGSDEPTITK